MRACLPASPLPLSRAFILIANPTTLSYDLLINAQLGRSPSFLITDSFAFSWCLRRGRLFACLFDRGMMTKKTMAEEGRKREGEGGSAVRTAETVLRVVPMGLCLAALVLMLKNAQVNNFGSISYADLTPFRYLVYANGFCAGYSLLSASCSAMPRPNTLSRSWLLFFFDQVFTYVILAAGTVSAEVTYLAYNGDEAVTWSKECVVFSSFCRRATASIGITFGAVACYAALSLLSSHRLFSTYEAPLAFVGKSGLETAAFPR